MVGDTCRRCRRTAPDGCSGNPSNYRVVAFLYVCHVAAHLRHYPGPFVAKHQRAGKTVILHLMELGVADPAGVKFDYNLICSWFGHFQFVNQKLAAWSDLNRGSGFHYFSKYHE